MVASGGVAVERGMEHGKIFPSPSAALPCQRVQWAKSTMTIAMTPTIGGRMPAMSRAKDFVFKNTSTAAPRRWWRPGPLAARAWPTGRTNGGMEEWRK
jgi:hypothetical protein